VNHLNCEMSVTLSDQEGIISNYMARDSKCGSAKSPLIISGMSGQTIALKIIDFGSEQLDADNRTISPSPYGYIQDGEERTAFYGSLERERFLYKSKTNEVALELEQNSDVPGFLLLYQSKMIIT